MFKNIKKKRRSCSYVTCSTYGKCYSMSSLKIRLIDGCTSKCTKWSYQEQWQQCKDRDVNKPSQKWWGFFAAAFSYQQAHSHQPKRVSDRLIISDPSHQIFQPSDNGTSPRRRPVSWGHFTCGAPERDMRWSGTTNPTLELPAPPHGCRFTLWQGANFSVLAPMRGWQLSTS